MITRATDGVAVIFDGVADLHFFLSRCLFFKSPINGGGFFFFVLRFPRGGSFRFLMGLGKFPGGWVGGGGGGAEGSDANHAEGGATTEWGAVESPRAHSIPGPTNHRERTQARAAQITASAFNPAPHKSPRALSF